MPFAIRFHCLFSEQSNQKKVIRALVKSGRLCCLSCVQHPEHMAYTPGFTNSSCVWHASSLRWSKSSWPFNICWLQWLILVVILTIPKGCPFSQDAAKQRCRGERKGNFSFGADGGGGSCHLKHRLLCCSVTIASLHSESQGAPFVEVLMAFL
jgi:hypothetical protein